MSYDPKQRPLPTEQQAEAGFGDRDGHSTNSYLAWASDVMMLPIIVNNVRDPSGNITGRRLGLAFGFNSWSLPNLPGESDLQHTLRYLKSVAEENVRVYENARGYITPHDLLVDNSYQKSKELLAELRHRENDRNYVAPSGVSQRRPGFGEADFSDGKTAVDGGRKRRRTSKRKHRKSKTAKRRRRR